MSLLGSLGLDDVPSDPNDIPDGRYNGVVFKDEFVVKSDDTVHHVITYKVEDPAQFAGAQKAEWFKVGINPERDATTNALVGFTPTMEETPKRWYKKRLASDLGLSDEQIAAYKPGDLTGKPVTFGIKTNNGWKNINFVETREAPENPTAAPSVGAL